MARSRPDTRNMKKLRAEYLTEGQRLDTNPDTRHLANCWICQQRIDYTAEPNTTPDSHNLDHYRPYSTHPELLEDPTNFRHSHQSCNTSRGDRTPTPGLGEPIPAWW